MLGFWVRTAQGVAGVAVATLVAFGGGCSGNEFTSAEGSGGSTTQDGGGGSAGSAGVGNAGAAGSSGSAGAGTAGAAGSGQVDPNCDAAEVPQPKAVFVSANSGADTNAGTATAPVQGISAALEIARNTQVSHIYLEAGSYNLSQTLQLGPDQGGYVIEGGWRKDGATWSPRCEFGRKALSTIAVARGVAVRVHNVGSLTMRHLTVLTKAMGQSENGQPGESLYAMWVSGSSDVDLLDVGLIAGNGGHAGTPLAPPPTPSSPSTCDGVTNCCTNESGCGSMNGPNAPAEPPRADPATASGEFLAESGYQASSGERGANGERGIHGAAGGVGQSTGFACRIGGSCGSCVNCQPDPGAGQCLGGLPPTATEQLIGGTGRCGCGGQPGSGGAGGRGGGASVALFIVGSSTVTVAASELEAGNGGDASLGQEGGQGGLGGEGQAGLPKQCVTGCNSGCHGTCGCEVSNSASGGSPGGLGGRGGNGGDGGGGPGGPSYVVVTLDGAQLVELAGNALRHGSGGQGAAGGPSGRSGVTP